MEIKPETHIVKKRQTTDTEDIMRVVETFPSTHNYYLHDLKYDFYGERIASCSSDHHIKVWDKVDASLPSQNGSSVGVGGLPSNNNNNNLIHHSTSNNFTNNSDQGSKLKTWKCVYDWKAHNGSIWKVEWAHPEFGQVLASCSYDHAVSIWEEPPANTGPGSGLAPLVISQGIIGQPSSASSTISRSVSLSTIQISSSSLGTTQNDGVVVDGNVSPPSSVNGAVAGGGVGGGGGLEHSSTNNSTTSLTNNTNTIVGNVNMVHPSSSTLQNTPLNNPHASRRSWLLKATLVDSIDDVVDIKFAPKHLGLKLATCSLSGKVRVYEAFDVMNLAHWSIGFDFDANNGGKIHCMSWCPYRFKEPMMVIGCEDGKLRIWHYTQNRKWQAWIPSIVVPNAQNISQLAGYTTGSTTLKPITVNEGNIAQVIPLIGHTQPIHDVSWAPNLGRSYDLIASASKDGSVRIWKLNSETKSIELMDIDETHKHNSEVWKVEWNLSGTVLASSGDDGSVRLWKYNFEEKKWKCESIIEGTKKDH